MFSTKTRSKVTGFIEAARSCSSWQDIQAKLRTFPEKQKGDLFEELVKAYLQLEPEYASKLYSYQEYLDVLNEDTL